MTETAPKVQARLTPELRRRLRRACADADLTIQQAVSEAVELWLQQRKETP